VFNAECENASTIQVSEPYHLPKPCPGTPKRNERLSRGDPTTKCKTEMNIKMTLTHTKMCVCVCATGAASDKGAAGPFLIHSADWSVSLIPVTVVGCEGHVSRMRPSPHECSHTKRRKVRRTPYKGWRGEDEYVRP
jgi:hypothetical protein